MGSSGGTSHVTTSVMGTYGYAAPKYIATGHLYVNSDVYGFGVVLLEMLTGLRAIDKNRGSGRKNLVDWAKPYLSQRRKLIKILDSRLEGKYPAESAFQMTQVALKCLEPDPKTRPSMKEVVETLERIDASNERSCGDTINLHFPLSKRESSPSNSRNEHGTFDILLPMNRGI